MAIVIVSSEYILLIGLSALHCVVDFVVDEFCLFLILIFYANDALFSTNAVL